jgi:ComEC/Rec2-related protein
MEVARPLVHVALALAGGALLGRGAGPWAVFGAGFAGLALALAPPGRAWRRHLGIPWAVLLVFVLAGLRADRARAAEPPVRRGADLGANGLGETLLVGRWRGRGRRGWLEPARGAAPGFLLELAAPPPEGTWIALLPGVECTPFASGPRPGPMAAEGRFHGEARAGPELVLTLAPPRASEGLAAALAARLGPAAARGRDALAARLGTFEARAGLVDGHAAGLLGALLLGRTAGLAPELSDLFTRTGTRHILAVSGMNVGLIFGMLAGLATRLPARIARGRPWRAALAGGLFAALYTPLAGGAAPVARAALMLGFALVAPTAIGGGRRADAWSLCALAFALETLAHPDAPARPAVALSYLATLGLFAPPGRSQTPARSEGFLGSESVLAVVWRRIARALRAPLEASIAATLATLPVSWALFGEVAPAGILATLAAVPLVAWLLSVACAASVWPSDVPGFLARAPLELLLACLELADRLPGTPAPLPPRPFVLVALAAWGGLYAWRQRRASRAVLGAAAAVLLPWSAHPADLEVVLLDVGNGTAIAARAPGLPALVADAGSRDRPRVASEALAPLLAHWDPGRVWAFLSHEHRDHAAALEWLLERHRPALYGGALPARLGERLAHGAEALDVGAGSLCLHPTSEIEVSLARGLAAPGNEGSRLLELRTPAARLLLFGDAEAEGLEALLQTGPPSGPVDRLLLPHHGSDSPYLGALLERWPAKRLWVSASGEVEVAGELDRRGLRWEQTGLGGRAGARSLRFPLPASEPRPPESLPTQK